MEITRGTATFAPQASAEDLAALVTGDTAFALDLLREGFDGGNLILSPFSIATALGMLEAGAAGDTRAEMARMLHQTFADDQLHQARGSLLAALAEAGKESGDDPPPFRLRAVNSLWLQRDYPIVRGYLDTLAGDYDAGLALLDFITDPDGARQVINDAVAEQTEGRIEDLIPEGVITALTRLVLTNAVYFKANWVSEFDPDQTAPGSFHLADGSTITVPMMSTTNTMALASGDGFTAGWMPYVGDASMVVILPAGDLDDLLGSLTADVLEQARAARAPHLVDLTMPRFEFRSELALSGLLQRLGMVAAFVPPPGEGSADLTGISETGDLYVQDVVHQGFISVDEKGTEAAAATAIVVGATSMPQPATLHLDRPFVFLIQQDSTGEILFAGVVAQP